MTRLSNDQLRQFANLGYVVVPNVVARHLIDAAMDEVEVQSAAQGTQIVMRRRIHP